MLRGNLGVWLADRRGPGQLKLAAAVYWAFCRVGVSGVKVQRQEECSLSDHSWF